MVTSYCMPYGQLAWLRAIDDVTARRFFDTPDSFVVGGPVPGYGCWPLRRYTSFDSYAHAFPGYASGYVLYDGEHYRDTTSASGTPVLEQQKPAAFISAFASLASARGQTMVASPSRDLVYVPGADNGILPGEDINAAYLRCGIPGAAKDAPILLVQAQGAQKDASAYAALVQGAKAQAPPDQVLWAGLTTSFATPGQMLAACQSVTGTATGFWVTIASQAQALTAANFFREIAAS